MPDPKKPTSAVTSDKPDTSMLQALLPKENVTAIKLSALGLTTVDDFNEGESVGNIPPWFTQLSRDYEAESGEPLRLYKIAYMDITTDERVVGGRYGAPVCRPITKILFPNLPDSIFTDGLARDGDTVLCAATQSAHVKFKQLNKRRAEDMARAIGSDEPEDWADWKDVVKDSEGKPVLLTKLTGSRHSKLGGGLVTRPPVAVQA